MNITSISDFETIQILLDTSSNIFTNIHHIQTINIAQKLLSLFSHTKISLDK